MKNQKTIFLIIGIVLAVIVGICAISAGKFVTGNSDTGRAKEATEKLSERYHKNIAILEIYPKKIGQAYYEVAAYAEDEPDIVFSAAIDTKDENFSDDYVERYICAQISKKIQENIGMQNNIYILTEAVGPQPITHDLNQTIQEYEKLDPLNKFRVSIFTASETSKNWSASTLFYGLGIHISGEVFTVNQKQLQAVKAHLSKNPNTNDFEYQQMAKDFPSITI